MGFHIGTIAIKDPVLLAPMAGITDLPFRLMVKRYGAGLVFSEMLASKVTIDTLRRKKMKELTDYKDEFPLVVQIAGCEAEIIAEAAKITEGKGAAIIDLNFGCPVKKIINKLGGSALMRDEALSAKIMEQAVKAVKIPVTVKMRLGWDSENQNAVTLAKIAEDCGVQMITVHGRTREQLFSGKADWSAVKPVKDAVKIPVIVNGDINSPEDAKKALEVSGADGVMIGRGCCGKPWLLQQTADYLANNSFAPAPDVVEIEKLILDHYAAMLELYGEFHGMNMARKHLGWYFETLPNSKDTSRAVKTSQSPEEVVGLIKNYFTLLGE